MTVVGDVQTAKTPVVKYSFGQSSIKGEDVIAVLPRNEWPQLRSGELKGEDEGCTDDGTEPGPYDDFALFSVFDGHNGVLAAKYISDHLLNRLVDKLPPGRPPPEHKPEFQAWREGIVRALSEVLSEMHLSFAKLGQLAGCTVTVVLQTGWLVTCANLGDSRAVIDNGETIMQLTEDHRVATNQSERRRVEGNGALIAPVCASGMGPAKDVNNGVGPLRIWPGGVCLSRGIGDFDVGNVIVPWPHVHQVRIPETGARLMLASDGVWDAFDHMSRIFKLSRSWQADSLPQRMISSIVRAHGGLRDDTSIIVVDIMPPGREFPQLMRKSAMSNAVSKAGGCFCFGGGSKPAADEEPEEEVPIVPIKVLVKQDVAQVLGQMPSHAPDELSSSWVTDVVKSRFLENHTLAFETWKRAAMEGALDVTPRQSLDYAAATTVAGVIDDATMHAGRYKAGQAVPDYSVRAAPVSRPQPLPQRPPGAPTQSPADYSVRAGNLYPAPGAPLGAQPLQPRAGGVGPSVGDASVRFARNVATSAEDFARRFGPYKGGDGEDSAEHHGGIPGAHGAGKDKATRRNMGQDDSAHDGAASGTACSVIPEA